MELASRYYKHVVETAVPPNWVFKKIYKKIKKFQKRFCVYSFDPVLSRASEAGDKSRACEPLEILRIQKQETTLK